MTSSSITKEHTGYIFILKGVLFVHRLMWMIRQLIRQDILDILFEKLFISLICVILLLSGQDFIYPHNLSVYMLIGLTDRKGSHLYLHICFL